MLPNILLDTLIVNMLHRTGNSGHFELFGVLGEVEDPLGIPFFSGRISSIFV